MFAQFKCNMECTNSEIDNQIQIMETKMQQASGVDHTEFMLIWEDSKLLYADLKHSVTECKAKSCNENVTFWSLFLGDLYPVLRDPTHSIRQGDWHLLISALRRCMPLFFGFGRTNYNRLGMLFLEDCLDPQRKFPAIYKCFIDGGWVMFKKDRI